jgi:WD40 repeat protein
MHAPSCSLRGIILWNEKYLIAASSDKAYKIFDIDEGTLDTVKTCHENVLCTIQKIVHPNLGECLFTCAIDGKIKLFSV